MRYKQFATKITYHAANMIEYIIHKNEFTAQDVEKLADLFDDYDLYKLIDYNPIDLKDIFLEYISDHLSKRYYYLFEPKAMLVMFNIVSKYAPDLLPRNHIQFENDLKYKIKLESKFKGTENFLYFAYGSNMDIDQMKHRCPSAKYVGRGVLRDYKFIIVPRGVASVIKSPGDNVYGVVYNVSAEDIEILDIYEGVDSGAYKKLLLPVKPQGNCLVYVEFEQMASRVKMPDAYRLKIIRAAIKYGLPQTYIKELRSWIVDRFN